MHRMRHAGFSEDMSQLSVHFVRFLDLNAIYLFIVGRDWLFYIVYVVLYIVL